MLQHKIGTNDQYRFEVVTAEGAQWFVVTDEDGILVEHGRMSPATIFSSLPARTSLR